MNAASIIHRLERYPEALRAAVGCVSPHDARFKPPTGAWSIVEIVCHLADEERDDFRARLGRTLARDPAPWPGIDPEGWARDRRYQDRELGPSLDEFIAERRSSIAWLRSLPATTDWSITHAHPKFGPITAGDLLASWGAHDALHLRQIAKRIHDLAGRDASPHSTRYAGDWTA